MVGIRKGKPIEGRVHAATTEGLIPPDVFCPAEIPPKIPVAMPVG
jgi:hypothetical protein